MRSGQRRYVESLSPYARQFLDMMERPDVDYIEGLSPAISIEQKTIGSTPRSTVGTVTEVYDFIRLLFARTGTQFCVDCNLPVEKQTVDQMDHHCASEISQRNENYDPCTCRSRAQRTIPRVTIPRCFLCDKVLRARIDDLPKEISENLELRIVIARIQSWEIVH